MIDLKKLLNQIKYFGIVFVIGCLTISCSEAEKKTEYVARVNDSYLTKSELERLAENYGSPGFSREELIDHWIREEILYQEAEKQGIVKSEEYKRLIDKSEKELAGAMLINKSYDKKKIRIDPQKLENYYNSKNEEFRSSSNSFVLNTFQSNDNAFAVQFRERALEEGWNRAAEEFKNDSSLIELKSNVFIKEENLYPQKLARIVQGLYPPEISIVISDETEYHWVVQVLNVLKKGSVIPFEFTKDEIEKRLIAETQKAMINDYVKSLYKNYAIELNN